MKILNKRKGPLVVSDAGIKFQAKEVLEVKKITPQLDKLLNDKFVVRVGDDVPEGVPEQEKESEDKLPLEYEKLSMSEAIEYIGDEEDVKKLNSLLRSETRKKIVDAIQSRLKELKK